MMQDPNKPVKSRIMRFSTMLSVLLLSASLAVAANDVISAATRDTAVLGFTDPTHTQPTPTDASNGD